MTMTMTVTIPFPFSGTSPEYEAITKEHKKWRERNQKLISIDHCRKYTLNLDATISNIFSRLLHIVIIMWYQSNSTDFFNDSLFLKLFVFIRFHYLISLVYLCHTLRLSPFQCHSNNTDLENKNNNTGRRLCQHLPCRYEKQWQLGYAFEHVVT